LAVFKANQNVVDADPRIARSRRPRWYVLRAKRLKDREVVERVRRSGFDAYSPRLRMPVVQGRSRYVMAPLFPGYVFVRADYLGAYHQLRWLPGVSSWLRFGGQPAFLDDQIVLSLRSEEGRKGYVKLRPPRLKPGDRVQILEGSLRGVEGLFECYLSPESRVRVLLNLVSYTARAEVELESVRRLSA
jgi:transcriptional antiterminator RfaH